MRVPMRIPMKVCPSDSIKENDVLSGGGDNTPELGTSIDTTTFLDNSVFETVRFPLLPFLMLSLFDKVCAVA